MCCKRFLEQKTGNAGKPHHAIGHYDDVIKWKHFARYWPFVRGIHRSPVNSPHKGLWRKALMFSLICLWINAWVNNREAGDLRRYRAHYDVIVMWCKVTETQSKSDPAGFIYGNPIFKWLVELLKLYRISRHGCGRHRRHHHQHRRRRDRPHHRPHHHRHRYRIVVVIIVTVPATVTFTHHPE